MEFDQDLHSIQQVRDLVRNSNRAQKIFCEFDNSKIDRILASITSACEENAERLAKMASDETGFGIWQDKVLKNLLGSRITYDYIRDMKTLGVINCDEENGIVEIGSPMGVVAAIIPSTNPTSTVMYKALISLKAGNGIVISPHPGAKKCILETVRVINEAAAKEGAPDGLIGCIENTTLQATQELMQHSDIGIILATGGEAMVRAAYSSGNPAIGVGPGNGPAFIEKSADIRLAVKRIFDSKTFDNGTICASEHSVVVEESIDNEVRKEMEIQGGYFLNRDESEKISKLLLRGNGSMNPAIVGKPVEALARMAGISIPANIKVLLSQQSDVSKTNPYSREKLCPVLGYYIEKNWQNACDRCVEILRNEGAGHTMVIHTNDKSIAMEFALKKPVSRLLVNTPGALGGVGATTNLAPAFTLGCGTFGKNVTSDNVTPKHLINIKRMAYGIKEIEDVRGKQPRQSTINDLSHEQIEQITRAVLSRLGGLNIS